MAYTAVICIPMMLLVKPIYSKLTEEHHPTKVNQKNGNYSKFDDEEEGEGEGEESPSKSKPFEKAVSEDEYGK